MMFSVPWQATRINSPAPERVSGAQGTVLPPVPLPVLAVSALPIPENSVTSATNSRLALFEQLAPTVTLVTAAAPIDHAMNIASELFAVG